MLTIQEAHEYLNLANLGIAKPVKCFNDEDHPDLISWVENEDVMFICLACSFKLRPGAKLAREIKFVINNFKS